MGSYMAKTRVVTLLTLGRGGLDREKVDRSLIRHLLANDEGMGPDRLTGSLLLGGLLEGGMVHSKS